MDIEKAIECFEKPSRHIHIHKTGNGQYFFAYSSDLVGAFELAISGLQELQQYRQIGTVDQCRETMEKQIQKEPDLIEVKQQGLVGDGTHTSEVSYQSDAYECPKCGSFLGFKIDCCDDEHYQDSFCSACGQALKWGD